MYLVTIQPKKQGEFEPKQILCNGTNLVECISLEFTRYDSAVVIVTYVKEY